MTEEEWMEGNEPAPMLSFLEGKTSDRKLRLFAVACCRRVWTLLEDNLYHRAVEMVEKFCDGAITEKVAADVVWRLHTHLAEIKGDWPDPACLVRRQAKAALACWRNGAFSAAWEAASCTEDLQAETACLPWDDWFAEQSQSQATYGKTKKDARSRQTQVLRDICGNPFSSVSLDSKCLTPTVQSLAQTIYDDRNFAQFPILADALEEAGCDQEDVLQHLRSGGEHVRGCWAIDVILGKS